MKKKSNKFIWIILALLIIFGVMIYLYVKPSSTDTTDTSTSSSSSSTTKTAVASTQTITKTISSSGEISSAETETISLSTSKYFKELLAEKNDSVKAGEKILKYSDGTYVTAPYNCVIADISVPSVGSKCTDTNCIKIQSTDSLYVTLSVNESDISTVKVGQEAEITISAYEGKKYTGTITKISDVGTYASSGSTFTANVKFTNDGSVKIGMSATCTVILEKAENVTSIPKEAIQTMNGTKYVVVVNSDGTTENVTVETGISNDAYIEIKSGLTGTETVQYTVTTSSSSGNNGFRQFMQNSGDGQVQVMGNPPSGTERNSGR